MRFYYLFIAGDLQPKKRSREDMCAAKTFVKQGSLDSSLQELNGDAVDSPQQRPLNRSLTISGGRRTSGAPGLTKARDSSSPLKRFSKAKDAISKTFGLIHDRLMETQSYVKLAHPETDSPSITSLLDRTRGIREILARDHMKVAFFGRTSNGKSSVVNALLGSKVLPAGIGHTTNCFVSVLGDDSDKGYLVKSGSQERQDIKNLKQLAHSLHKEHLDPSSLVQVYWPKTQCPLLKDDVELVDSPGIDMNPNMDEWINKHCLDADVFVLVSNAESTLMTAEKNFFHRVSERLSMPNIFILNNRWDCSAQEPEMRDEVREQHLETDVDFLAKELQVVDEETAKNRVFFVSAKEAVIVRGQQRKLEQERDKKSKTEIGKGLAEGWRARLMEFERFEKTFKECISSAAIKIKFEQHHKRGSEVVQELEQLVSEEEISAIQIGQSVNDQLRQCSQRRVTLLSKASDLKELCRQQLSSAVLAVEQKIAIVMRDVLGQLGTVVDRYEATFDENDTENYKKGLYVYVDKELEQELAKVGSTALSELHDEAPRYLIGKYQELLQLPEDELSRFSQLVRPPELTYILRCEDLCLDFKEDLVFHFSLFGLRSLLISADVGSLMGSVKSKLSLLWSILPAEYAIPGVLLLIGMMIPRVHVWRYLLPSLCLFGATYAYEYVTWTPRSKESALKTQFIQQMRAKLSTQIRATSSSYTNQMSNNLDLLLDSLHNRLETTQQEVNNQIAQLTQEQTKYSQLQDKAKKLRNAVHLIQEDLSDFKEEYLDDGDTLSS